VIARKTVPVWSVSGVSEKTPAASSEETPEPMPERVPAYYRRFLADLLRSSCRQSPGTGAPQTLRPQGLPILKPHLAGLVGCHSGEERIQRHPRPRGWGAEKPSGPVAAISRSGAISVWRACRPASTKGFGLNSTSPRNA